MQTVVLLAHAVLLLRSTNSSCGCRHE